MQWHRMQRVECWDRPALAFKDFIKGEFFAGIKAKVLERCGGKCEKCHRVKKGFNMTVVQWPGNWYNFKPEDIVATCWHCSKREKRSRDIYHPSLKPEYQAKVLTRYTVLGDGGVADNGKKITRIRTW